MEQSVNQDRFLVHSYVQGNEQALEQLINKHQQKVFGFILKKVRNEDVANDIFQDTFVKVIQTLKAGRYNEEGKFIQWVMRIAHNLVIDYFRREKRMPLVRETEDFNVLDILNDGERNAEELTVYQQILKDAHNLVDHLPVEQKMVLRMRIYEGLSFKEIADKTDVSINTALGRMRYALINMRKLIEKHEILLME
jgi:RNA polymerase sigma-70 factor (ECF subfamily)